MDSPRIDFLAQYRAISAKLKKRFLRKPNVAEASADFSRLARNLENEEWPHYAAFCYLAVARCERTIGSPVYEAHNLHQAAKLFLRAENESHELLCPSWGEYLQAALSAYRDCIKVHIDNGQPALAAAMYLEVAESLRDLGRVNQAVPYYLSAAEMHKGCTLDYIIDMRRVIECRLILNEYEDALSALTEIQIICERNGMKQDGFRIGAFTAILGEVEVSRLLLLLFLNPPLDKLNPEHKKLLARYEDTDIDPVDYIEDEPYLLLQSLQIAVHESNEKALEVISESLYKYLRGHQRDLLSKILEKYRD